MGDGKGQARGREGAKATHGSPDLIFKLCSNVIILKLPIDCYVKRSWRWENEDGSYCNGIALVCKGRAPSGQESNVS